MGLKTEIAFPPFRLDVGNEQLWREEQLIALRPKTFVILRYLAEHPGRLVTKNELLRAVWGDTQVSEAGLRDYLREIRQALSDDPKVPRFIETVHGRGYRFIPPLSTTAQPVRSSESGVRSPQPAPSTQHLVPTLVGREAELAQLQRWLEKALKGERQLVFVTGEPGIGKTALVEAFVAQVGAHGDASEGDGVVWIGRGQCIEHYGAGEAYLPVLEALGRLCRGAEGERVIAVLRKHAPMWLVQLPAFIDGEELEVLQRKVQGASRERMLRELAEALEVLTGVGAGLRPALVLVLEDLHWSDVSTLDFLAALARRKEAARLLVIGTYRPVEVASEGHPLKSHIQELATHQLCGELALGPLNQADIEAYLVTRLPVPSPSMGEACPERSRRSQGEGERLQFLRRLARTLHHRTDGNPLFLVSLVDDLVARGVLSHTSEGWTLRNEANTIAVGIPETIRHLVARQRERLQPEEQRVLEAASVAGMEFSAAAVAAAVDGDIVAIEKHCERLAERQHFLRRVGIETWPDGTLAARYSFLHALYQQLWHERVSPTQLQHCHLQIGERKERAYGEQVRGIAAELAIHFEQAREYQKALQYHGQAAQHALQHSAPQEATVHLTTGLTLLHTLPDTPERAQQELGLRMSLGRALMMTKGYAAPEVEAAYARAHALCQQLEDTPQLFPVLLGLITFYVVRAKLPLARELAEHCFALAQRVNDSALLLEAHRALVQVLLPVGELTLTRLHGEKGLALYDPHRHHAHAFLYGHDPGVYFLVHKAYVLWALGYPDQALKTDYEALTLARELGHPFTLAAALFVSAVLYQHRREEFVMQQRLKDGEKISTEHGFGFYLLVGDFLQARALTEHGQVEKGIAQLQQCLATNRTIGTEQLLPYWLLLLAEAHGKGGQPEEGLKVLTEALAMVERTGERLHEAELYRLKGELTLQKLSVASSQLSVTNPQSLTPNPQAEAEACFLKAIEIARRQQAKSLELRATVSLARLWKQQSKTEAARQMLAEIYNWFTEGFDTADLQEAKALLEGLERKTWIEEEEQQCK